MTRLLTAGAEGGSEDVERLFWTSAPASNLGWIAGPDLFTARTGGYCYRLLTTTTLEKNVGNTDEIYMGIAVNYGAVATTAVINFTDCNVYLRINTSGVIQFMRASTIAASGGALVLGQWHYLEIYLKPLDSNGRLVVKVDGNSTPVIDFTGDCNNAGNQIVAAVQILGNHASTPLYVDDIVINNASATNGNNTYPGQVKLFPMRVKGNGDANQLTRAGWDLGQNSNQVREYGGGLSWIEGTTTDNRDLFTVDTPDLPAGATISNVIVSLVGRTGGGGKQVAGVVKVSGDSEEDGTTTALGANWGGVQHAWAINPYTDAAWVEADLTGLQLGAKIK